MVSPVQRDAILRWQNSRKTSCGSMPTTEAPAPCTMLRKTPAPAPTSRIRAPFNVQCLERRRKCARCCFALRLKLGFNEFQEASSRSCVAPRPGGEHVQIVDVMEATGTAGIDGCLRNRYAGSAEGFVQSLHRVNRTSFFLPHSTGGRQLQGMHHEFVNFSLGCI